MHNLDITINIGTSFIAIYLLIFDRSSRMDRFNWNGFFPWVHENLELQCKRFAIQYFHNTWNQTTKVIPSRDQCGSWRDKSLQPSINSKYFSFFIHSDMGPWRETFDKKLARGTFFIFLCEGIEDPLCLRQKEDQQHSPSLQSKTYPTTLDYLFIVKEGWNGLSSCWTHFCRHQKNIKLDVLVFIEILFWKVLTRLLHNIFLSTVYSW